MACTTAGVETGMAGVPTSLLPEPRLDVEIGRGLVDQRLPIGEAKVVAPDPATASPRAIGGAVEAGGIPPGIAGDVIGTIAGRGRDRQFSRDIRPSTQSSRK